MVKPVYEFADAHGNTVRVRDSGTTPDTRAVIDIPRRMRGSSTLMFNLSEFFATVAGEYATAEQAAAQEAEEREREAREDQAEKAIALPDGATAPDLNNVAAA